MAQLWHLVKGQIGTRKTHTMEGKRPRNRSGARGAGAEAASHLLVPTAVVPMPAQVRLFVGHDDHVECPGWNRHLAAGADVVLAGRIRLDRRDGHPEKIAHARTAKIAMSAITMTTMSVTSFS